MASAEMETLAKEIAVAMHGYGAIDLLPSENVTLLAKILGDVKIRCIAQLLTLTSLPFGRRNIFCRLCLSSRFRRQRHIFAQAIIGAFRLPAARRIRSPKI